MNIQRKNFQNGLRVILAPNKESYSTTVMVAVMTGSKYEDKKVNGISHFLEHMCFKGTLKRPKSIDISRELDGIGAESNAFTSYEYTAYYAKANYKHFKKVIDVVSDIYLNSTLPEAELEKEKGVIIEEINMYEDFPKFKVQEIFYELLYGDQSVGRSILGTKESVTSLKRQDFVKYKKDHYVASGTVIIISGNFEKMEALKLVKEHFKNIPVEKKKDKLKVKELQKEPQVVFKSKKTDQAHIVLGFRALKATDKDNANLEVLSSILGQGMSSRLFQRLREDMGASYYVNATNDPFTDHGIFSISAGIDKNRITEVVKVIVNEISDLKENLVSEDELEKAKEYVIGNLYLDVETTSAVAGHCLAEEALRGEVFSPIKISKSIKAVTPESLLKTAKKVFRGNGLNLAVISEKLDLTAIKNILKV